jgi:hypothetical protein
VERREVGVEWWCARARCGERSEEKGKGEEEEEEEAARWEEGIGQGRGAAPCRAGLPVTPLGRVRVAHDIICRVRARPPGFC